MTTPMRHSSTRVRVAVTRAVVGAASAAVITPPRARRRRERRETSDNANPRARDPTPGWCGRSIAMAAVINGLAGGIMLSYFEKSAFWWWRRRLSSSAWLWRASRRGLILRPSSGVLNLFDFSALVARPEATKRNKPGPPLFSPRPRRSRLGPRAAPSLPERDKTALLFRAASFTRHQEGRARRRPWRRGDSARPTYRRRYWWHACGLGCSLI